MSLKHTLFYALGWLWLITVCAPGSVRAQAVVVQAVVAQAGQAGQAPPPPIASRALPTAEDFVRPPQFRSARMSPSGKRLSVILGLPNGRSVGAVVELEPPYKRQVVAAFADADIDTLHWVNDNRLVYAASKAQYLLYEGEAGLFAVDSDGKNMRQLVAWSGDLNRTGTRIVSRVLTYEWRLSGTLDDGSNDVIVYRSGVDSSNDPYAVRPSRLNTTTGALRDLGADLPPFTSRWVMDSQGAIRVVTVQRNGRFKLMWRPKADAPWETLEDQDQTENAGIAPFVPLALDGEDEVVVEGRWQRDTSALYSYKLREKRWVPEPLVAIAGYDLDAEIRSNRQNGRLLGVGTLASMPLNLWFDDRLAGIQKSLDDHLPPGRSNTLICSRCEDSDQFVVLSSSDRHPGELLHYDHAKKSLAPILSRRPYLPEKTQGSRSFHRVAARDGLMLPVVVTHPAGNEAQTPLPAVVLVHGGPWVRGTTREWSHEAQFLASRGWRVLEVDFRGSQGLGWRHFHAGWKQWGLAMQDDLADAVAWAVEQKWVDAAKVCIAGSSYGGYAALMGVIRHPQMYRCAASHVGVTDLFLRYSAEGDLPSQARRFSLPTLMGHPERDAAQFRATSPVLRAAEIKVPVLLAQAIHDRRVPPSHADAFEKAARAAGVQVQRINYDEGHGWSDFNNHADYLRQLEIFIQRALGP